MYDEAVRIVMETNQASISMIQRRLRIGYNRAARMVEQMEREGIVMPADGAQAPRSPPAQRAMTRRGFLETMLKSILSVIVICLVAAASAAVPRRWFPVRPSART